MLKWGIVVMTILAGLGLNLAELLFLPGLTVAGVLGVVLSFFGVYLSYDYFGSTIGHITLFLTVLSNVTALVYSLRSGVWDKYALKESIDAKVNEEPLAELSVGDVGMCLSTLRPVGNAEFGGKTFEVKTKSGFLEEGTQISIVRIEGSSIWVAPLKKLGNA
jgi:membrane-bound ClpP family serine protease